MTKKTSYNYCGHPSPEATAKSLALNNPTTEGYTWVKGTLSLCFLVSLAALQSQQKD